MKKKKEKDSIKIYTESTCSEFDMIPVNIEELIFTVLKTKGFVRDNLGGKIIFVKNFTFVLIDQQRSKVTIGDKVVDKKEIVGITVGTDINDNRHYGKGIQISPRRITDLILTLDYFDRMSKK